MPSGNTSCECCAEEVNTLFISIDWPFDQRNRAMSIVRSLMYSEVWRSNSTYGGIESTIYNAIICWEVAKNNQIPPAVVNRLADKFFELISSALRSFQFLSLRQNTYTQYVLLLNLLVCTIRKTITNHTHRATRIRHDMHRRKVAYCSTYQSFDISASPWCVCTREISEISRVDWNY